MQERLFSLMKDAARNPHTDIAVTEWKNAYDAFSTRVAQLSDGECTPRLMRTIDHARIETDMLLSVYSPQEEETPASVFYCRKANEILRCEMKIQALRLAHPGFKDLKQKVPATTLYLNEEYHATDLVEIITPLFELGVFKSANGNRAQLQAIIKIFEWAFNTPMPNYDVLRSAAINRKIHLTGFLDKMKNVLVRLSQQ